MSLDHSEHPLSLRFLFGYGDFSRTMRTRRRRPLLSRIRRASQDNRRVYHGEGGISADDRHVGDPRGTVFSDSVGTATDRRTPESTRSPGFLRKGSGVRREPYGDAPISRQLVDLTELQDRCTRACRRVPDLKRRTKAPRGRKIAKP